MGKRYEQYPFRDVCTSCMPGLSFFSFTLLP
jgi:hypothetical protein